MVFAWVEFVTATKLILLHTLAKTAQLLHVQVMSSMTQVLGLVGVRALLEPIKTFILEPVCHVIVHVVNAEMNHTYALAVNQR